MKIAVILLGIVAFATIDANSNTFTDVDLEWFLFVIKFNKNYTTNEEYQFRKSVFAENFKSIAKHNELYRKGLEPYELTVNTYSDFTHAEFVQKMVGFVRDDGVNDGVNDGKSTAIAYMGIPDAIDYRTNGYVTPVKNQGSCLSAWAFSAVGALEGQVYRTSKKLIPLSVQNLIDCSSSYKNRGCEGGTVLGALRYISNVGINNEFDYPYEAKDGVCRFDSNKNVTSSFGFKTIHKNETSLKNAVALLGPVSATIDVSQNDFRWYKSGVYYNAKCSSTNVTHAVLIVGYGTDAQGRDYWIVKNSWGSDWGENGYALMARNRNNNCGIATLASVPTM